MGRKIVACSLSQLRKHELNYLTSYPELSIVKIGITIFLEVKVTFRRNYKSLQDIFMKLVLSLWYPCWNEIDYDLEKCYHLEKQKSQPMLLAMESCANKVWVTPRTKNCIPSLSNLIRIINVLKNGGKFSFCPRDSSGSIGR